MITPMFGEHVTRAHAGTRHVSHGEHAPLAYLASRFLPRFLTPALCFLTASLIFFSLCISHNFFLSCFPSAKFKCILLSHSLLFHIFYSLFVRHRIFILALNDLLFVANFKIEFRFYNFMCRILYISPFLKCFCIT